MCGGREQLLRSWAQTGHVCVACGLSDGSVKKIREILDPYSFKWAELEGVPVRDYTGQSEDKDPPRNEFGQLLEWCTACMRYVTHPCATRPYP